MSASIIVSPAAERDIRAILDDLETEAGPLVADRYADKFEQAFATLAFTPGLGAPRPNMGTWTRQTLVQPTRFSMMAALIAMSCAFCGSCMAVARSQPK